MAVTINLPERTGEGITDIEAAEAAALAAIEAQEALSIVAVADAVAGIVTDAEAAPSGELYVATQASLTAIEAAEDAILTPTTGTLAVAEAAAIEAVSQTTAGADNIVSQFDIKAPNQRCAVIKTATEYHLYSPLHVTGFWDVHECERTTAGAEYRPTTRRVQKIADIYHHKYDSFTLGGTWASDLTSGSLYLGGITKSTVTTGTYAEKSITVTGASNVIEVIYGVRDGGNHIAVTIDGAGTLVNLLPTNGSGEKYIDSYNVSTSLIPTQRTAVAIVPAGTYTVRVTMSALYNASNVAATKRFYFEGLAVTGGEAGLPGGAQTHAPQWITGEAVITNTQRWNAGITYRATGSGTTGATAPTHTSGTVSDGTVSWIPTDTDSYALFSETYFTDVSEPFYAVWLALNGGTEEDFGGDIHGGTTLSSIEVIVDGFTVTPTDLQPLYGNAIMLRQISTGAHTAAPGTPVFSVRTDYTARPGGDFPYAVKLTPLYSGLRGLTYPGMLPLYAYHVSQGFRYQVRRCLVPSVGEAAPSSYYGQTNPAFGSGPAQQLGALIELGSTAGSAGVPAADPSGTYLLAVSLEMTRGTMGDYAESGATAYWDMNTGGVDASAGGYTGHAVKGYFRRSDGVTKVAVAANEPMFWRGTYRSRLFVGQAGEP